MATTVGQPSPGSVWSAVFGEALASPGCRKRNKKLNDLTPSGEHLSDTSAAWLAKHQTKAQGRLERKVASRLVNLRRERKAGNGGDAAISGARIVPLPVRAWAGRRPSLVSGKEPQVLAFDMDVLVERYRESIWEREVTTRARSGLIAALIGLRERFLLCAFCRALPKEAADLLSVLQRKGFAFDYAYAVPPASARSLEAPVLDGASMRLLR